MKKNKFYQFLFLVFTHLSFVSASSEVKFEGRARAKHIVDGKTDFSNYYNYSVLSLQPKVTFIANPKTEVIFEPSAAKYFGELAYLPVTINYNSRYRSSGGSRDTALGFHQGYLLRKWDDKNSTMFGRMELTFGDELLIGTNKWHHIGRSFDGFRQSFHSSLGETDLFFTKIAENFEISDGDVDFHGIHQTFNELLPWMNVWDVYAFYLKDGRGSRPEHLWTLGTRASNLRDKFLYQFEVSKQFSVTNGFQSIVDLGYKNQEAVFSQAIGSVFYASNEFNSLFGPRHGRLGQMELFDYKNIWGVAANVGFTFSNSWEVFADYFLFRRVDDKSTLSWPSSKTELGRVQKSSSKEIAQELDLRVKNTIDESFSFDVGASHGEPGLFLKENFGSDLRMLLFYLQFEAKF